MAGFSTVLVEFMLRLAGGIAASLLLVPDRQVEGRFFRNKLVIVLGLLTVAMLAQSSRIASGASGVSPPRWELLAAGVIAYVGGVLWMLERRGGGRAVLGLLAVAALHMAASAYSATGRAIVWRLAEPISSGLLVGSIVIAMLLGHWYLNAPGMTLAPIRRLVLACGGLLLLRAVVVVVGMASFGIGAGQTPLLFWILRWSAGLLLPLVLCGMVWWTLKVPNTQSATGILYAMVVLIFIGELVALLLDP